MKTLLGALECVPHFTSTGETVAMSDSENHNFDVAGLYPARLTFRTIFFSFLFY